MTNTVEIKIRDALQSPFEAGKGVIYLQAGMSDADILSTVKFAATYEKPFMVVPASGRTNDEENTPRY